jgi:hypothetical protein
VTCAIGCSRVSHGQRHLGPLGASNDRQGRDHSSLMATTVPWTGSPAVIESQRPRLAVVNGLSAETRDVFRRSMRARMAAKAMAAAAPLRSA